MMSWLRWQKYRLKRVPEAVARWIAWHLPKEVVKWCFYRMAAHATTGKYGNTLVPGLTWETIAKRWPSK